jgi:hypothetical protein
LALIYDRVRWSSKNIFFSVAKYVVFSNLIRKKTEEECVV